MKKIVPFNNVLNFNTDVREITAISLEPNIQLEKDLISGIFNISGEYKITDGQLEKEKFNFELPFDIALSNEYRQDTLLVDIDDFRYELIDYNKLKVNIDLYIDGEVIESKQETIKLPEIENLNSDETRINKDEELVNIDNLTLAKEHEPSNINDELTERKTIDIEEPIARDIPKRIDLLEEMLTTNKEEPVKEETIITNNDNNNNESNNINLFNSFNEEEKYVTYRVYRVLDTDTIDKILEKYNITKEELAIYNNIEDIKPGTKLIIPTNDK